MAKPIKGSTSLWASLTDTSVWCLRWCWRPERRQHQPRRPAKRRGGRTKNMGLTLQEALAEMQLLVIALRSSCCIPEGISLPAC